jgi:peptide/nickel transport system substrate-binding protein
MRSPDDANTTRTGFFVAISLMIAAIVATGGGCARRHTPDDTVVVLIDVQVKDPDPRFAYTSSDLKLSKLVASGLTAVDTPDMVPRLDLARAVNVTTPLDVYVTLKGGLRFNDGSPLTADDVAWTFTSAMGPALGSLSRKWFNDRYEWVRAEGPLTVHFKLKAPLATLMTDLDYGIVSHKAAGPDGRFANGKVVGAGPYRVTSISPTRIRYERNDYYYGAKPELRYLDIRTVRDANARLVMLIGGSADLAQNVVRYDLLDVIARRDRVAVDSAPSAILTYMLLNNTSKPLDDLRVREAIALALDREEIIRARFGGRAVLATGLLAPSVAGYEGDVTRWDHDAARAKALLDEAGFPDPDGDGPRPRLTLSYKASSDQFRVSIARLVAAQLARVGIAVELRSFEFATFFADIKKGNYQLAMMQTSDIGGPDFYHTFFHSSEITSPEHPDGYNRWHYKNAEIDRLTDEGRAELDAGKRAVIYTEVQQIIARDVPIIPMWHEDNVALTGAGVHGYTILPNARLAGLATVTKGP